MMLVGCPECCGRRTMEYYVLPEDVDVTDEPISPFAEATVEKRSEPCRTCKGTGRVTATKPIIVRQCGKRVGTVPASFDPARIKSKSFWYTPRPNDFRREGDEWIACRSLGPGDLESIPGFVWDREDST